MGRMEAKRSKIVAKSIKIIDKAITICKELRQNPEGVELTAGNAQQTLGPLVEGPNSP